MSIQIGKRVRVNQCADRRHGQYGVVVSLPDEVFENVRNYPISVKFVEIEGAGVFAFNECALEEVDKVEEEKE